MHPHVAFKSGPKDMHLFVMRDHIDVEYEPGQWRTVPEAFYKKFILLCFPNGYEHLFDFFVNC